MSLFAERNRLIKERDAEKRREAARATAQRLTSITHSARPPVTPPTPPAPPQAPPQALHPIYVPATLQAPTRNPPPQPQIMGPPAAPPQANPIQGAPTIATGPRKLGICPLAACLDADGDILMNDADSDVPCVLANYKTVASVAVAPGRGDSLSTSAMVLTSVETPPIGLGEIVMEGC